MDATPLLGEVARRLNDVRLEAVLIGNAGAALQGAPVTNPCSWPRLWISSPASVRHAGRATWPCSAYWRRHVQPKRPTRRSRLDALARESERHRRELIERWQRLPPERRTNFLRKRVAPGRSAL
jgi:hypothetical protein